MMQMPPGAGEQPPPGPPTLMAPPAPMPAVMGAPAQAPPPPRDPNGPPTRLPPTLRPGAKIAQRPPSDQIKNPFERTAAMIDDAARDYAKRLSEHLSEAAADSVEADPQTVHEMMQFSPYGSDAPSAFWQMHDRLLEEATKAGDPDPYAAAERGALDEVYPYRAKIALLDVLGPEERVERAELLMRMSHGQIAKGQPTEALPFITGPAGLPAAPEPEVPKTNGRQNGGAY